jgi:NADH-quinone oxidoreductase subunit I
MNVPPPRARELSLAARLYVPEILKGLWITNWHFWRNLVQHALHQVGLRKTPGGVTVQYPEVRRFVPQRARFVHRLTQRADGSTKCVACMLCPSVCPAQCIHVEAEESPDPAIEKRPAVFDIDLSRCVFCGFCVEACPVDAIRMDTGIIPPASFDRFRMVIRKDELLANRPSDGTLKTISWKY